MGTHYLEAPASSVAVISLRNISIPQGCQKLASRVYKRSAIHLPLPSREQTCSRSLSELTRHLLHPRREGARPLPKTAQSLIQIPILIRFRPEGARLLPGTSSPWKSCSAKVGQRGPSLVSAAKKPHLANHSQHTKRPSPPQSCQGPGKTTPAQTPPALAAERHLPVAGSFKARQRTTKRYLRRGATADFHALRAYASCFRPQSLRQLFPARRAHDFPAAKRPREPIHFDHT